MYRVMTSDGECIDRDTQKEADIVLKEKKLKLVKMKSIDGEKPEVSIHECHNNDGGKCINWQRFTK